MRAEKRLRLIQKLERQFPEYSKEKLKAKLLAGVFKVDGETVYDPNRFIHDTARCEEVQRKYVSRGGLKLEYALKSWGIPVTEKVFLDAGASTGGFTDCLLQSGARFVHAVDVGYNQIDFSLRTDPRVQVHERKNIMDCTDFDPPPHAAVADLSFRSVVSAAEHIVHLTLEKWAIILIKPQFEYAAERGDQTDEERYFNGVLQDTEIIRQMVVGVLSALKMRNINAGRLDISPIQGRKGNSEFLAYIFRNNGSFPGTEEDGKVPLIEDLVDTALA